MEIDGIKFKVNLWGTLGQEKYRQIVKLFFIKQKANNILQRCTTFIDLAYFSSSSSLTASFSNKSILFPTIPLIISSPILSIISSCHYSFPLKDSVFVIS